MDGRFNDAIDKVNEININGQNGMNEFVSVLHSAQTLLADEVGDVSLHVEIQQMYLNYLIELGAVRRKWISSAFDWMERVIETH